MTKKRIYRDVYRYDIYNKEGKLEPWTGQIGDKEAADKWYNKYGKKHEAEGKKLKRVRYRA